MKRKMRVFMAVAVVMMLFCGCGSSKKAENLKITLEENPTTGYTLTYEIKDETVVKFVSDEYIKPDSEKAGAGGEHVYEFAGLKEGETTITFTSRQDWDGGETGDTKEVVVMVDKDCTITEKK